MDARITDPQRLEFYQAIWTALEEKYADQKKPVNGDGYRIAFKQCVFQIGQHQDEWWVSIRPTGFNKNYLPSGNGSFADCFDFWSHTFMR